MAYHCISGGECTGCMVCEELKVVLKCDYCGEEIYEGDTYYKAGEDNYCEYCVERREAQA